MCVFLFEDTGARLLEGKCLRRQVLFALKFLNREIMAAGFRLEY